MLKDFFKVGELLVFSCQLVNFEPRRKILSRDKESASSRRFHETRPGVGVDSDKPNLVVLTSHTVMKNPPDE